MSWRAAVSCAAHLCLRHCCCRVQLTRLCNAVLKRLGKHEVGGKARLLMLLGSITPLFDRSGVGVTVSWPAAAAAAGQQHVQHLCEA